VVIYHNVPHLSIITVEKWTSNQNNGNTPTVADKQGSTIMSGFKRDRQGNAKRQEGFSKPATKQIERNALTPMFEKLRDELDAHHDRRDRIGKASRDITALSKKM
jgi:hypothetical protein